MFYAHFVLSKKGPLAKVWLAAHWDKKLTKTHVFETDVEKTVDDIISPKVKMALRTSGHLLLGVVRIYSRKQKYLIQDLGEACAKIKMAFRPGIVDLPMEGTVAVGDTITLPEIFQNFESAVADLNMADLEEDRYRSRAEDITMRDDGASNRFQLLLAEPMDNNEFGGMLEDIEIPRKSSLSFQSHISDSSHLGVGGDRSAADKNLMETDRQFENRGLEGGDFGVGFGDGGFGDFGQGGLQEDLLDPALLPRIDNLEFETSGGVTNVPVADREEAMDVDQIILPPPQEETIREDEGFVLEPLDVTVGGGKVRQRRKRKLVVDVEKELRGETIRAQLQDPSDTLRPKIFPPPVKKALIWKENYGVEQLYHSPTLSCLAPPLALLVTSNLHQLSPSDAKVDASLLQDIELPRNEEPVVEPAAPVDNEEAMLPEDVSHIDMREPEFELEDAHINNEIPPLPLDGEEGDEEHVSRIIPVLPDLEGEGERDEPTPSASDSAVADPTGEERRWNKRTQQVLKVLDKCFEQTETIHFTDITRRCSRKQVAARFYSCLLLAKEGTISIEQKEPYANIVIRSSRESADVA